MKKSVMLKAASIAVLDDSAMFICTWLNREYRDTPETEEIRNRITKYMEGRDGSYRSYLLSSLKQGHSDRFITSVFTEEADSFIQFLRSKLCLFLAAEYEALGE